MVLDAVLDHSISDVLLTADAAMTVEEAPFELIRHLV